MYAQDRKAIHTNGWSKWHVQFLCQGLEKHVFY